MSKLYENEYGFFISHEKYINGLSREADEPLKVNPKLFSIKKQYKSHKNDKKKIVNCNDFADLQREQNFVKSKFDVFIKYFLQECTLNDLNCCETDNKDALEMAEFVYDMSGKALVKDALGSNIGPATVKVVNGNKFFFPQNSIFFCKDVEYLEKYLRDKKYDLILLDPPWWNKYIRRKRKKSEDAYKMLFNSDIKNLPIESLLKDNGLVVVWCTNSPQNIQYLLTEIFPKWNIKYVGKWYWIKVTLTGEPVCEFSLPPGKQPYEQIIFGCRGEPSVPFVSKLVVSIPSAIHSHKPPLIELIKTFLPDNPLCLEIFARYLLPNWTSYGNEVLRLQHESIFVTV